MAKEKTTYAQDLYEAFSACYRKNALPSEYGAPWAVKGKKIDLRGYDHFPKKDRP